MNHITFETSKELAKYLQVETENYWDTLINYSPHDKKATEYGQRIIKEKEYKQYDTYEHQHYPAPTLEELNNE